MSKELAAKSGKELQIDKDKILSQLKEHVERTALKHIESDDVTKHHLTDYLTTELMQTFAGRDLDHFIPALEVIGTAKPKDAVELMLATQMFLINDSILDAHRYLKKPASVSVYNQYVNSITKLSRTFTGQMDSLKKYQGKGQQKIVVEHLNVNQGGRAVVGDVSVEAKGEGVDEK